MLEGVGKLFKPGDTAQRPANSGLWISIAGAWVDIAASGAVFNRDARTLKGHVGVCIKATGIVGLVGARLVFNALVNRSNTVGWHPAPHIVGPMVSGRLVWEDKVDEERTHAADNVQVIGARQDVAPVDVKLARTPSAATRPSPGDSPLFRLGRGGVLVLGRVVVLGGVRNCVRGKGSLGGNCARGRGSLGGGVGIVARRHEIVGVDTRRKPRVDWHGPVGADTIGGLVAFARPRSNVARRAAGRGGWRVGPWGHIGVLGVGFPIALMSRVKMGGSGRTAHASNVSREDSELLTR